MGRRLTPGTTYVEDLWERKDGTPKERHGKGLRYRAIWVDNTGARDSKTFRRKIDATSHLKDVTAQLRTHTYVTPEAGRITVGELVARHLEAMTGKPTTLRAAQGAAKKLVLPRWEKVPVNAVSPEDVRVWIAGLLRGDGERKPAAASYVRQGGLILHAVLKNAVGDRRIAYDPMDRVKLPKAGKSRDQNPLTIKQVYALADALTIKGEDGQPAPGVRQVDRALLLTLCFTGLRVGEALGITASAMDFNARRIHIRRTYGPDQQGRIIEGTPKSGESRWVPIPPQIMGELLALCEDREPKQDVFTGDRGGTIHAGNWRRRVYTPALQACGLYEAENPRTVHDLRHTFASLAVKAGANVKALQNALGHANASMTLDVYSHLFDEDLDALGEKLGGLGSGHAQDPGGKQGQRGAGTHQVHTTPILGG